MLEEHKDEIYKHFYQLVRCSNFEFSMKNRDPEITKILENMVFTTDSFHNNRIFLFDLMESGSLTIFDAFVKALHACGCHDVASKLDDKPSGPFHKTRPFKMPDDELADTFEQTMNMNEPQKVTKVKYAKGFCDTTSGCYRTRSKRRGHVLIINNIEFKTQQHPQRQGAIVDEKNLLELFEGMNFLCRVYRNLSKDDMKAKVVEFVEMEPSEEVDICFVYIMSHGDIHRNKTCIIGSDGQRLEEDWIKKRFTNNNCPLFKNKPKILTFHVCRGEENDLVHHNTQSITEYDSACVRKPEIADGDSDSQDDRLYSDLLICHPSVEGFKAHRDTLKGSWYIELICRIFNEEAHRKHVEQMLKDVDRELKKRISETYTRQTSTFQNFGFNDCYLNPGIYEEQGQFKYLKP